MFTHIFLRNQTEAEHQWNHPTQMHRSYQLHNSWLISTKDIKVNQTHMNFRNQIIEFETSTSHISQIRTNIQMGFPNLTPQTHREVRIGSSRKPWYWICTGFLERSEAFIEMGFQILRKIQATMSEKWEMRILGNWGFVPLNISERLVEPGI